MKHILIFILAFAASAIAARASSDGYDAGCVIERFDYFANVHADNTWEVKECIHANFKEPSHGIFQYVEQKYNIEFGGKDRSYFAPVSNVEVANFKHKITYLDHDRFTVIRIGDSSSEIMGEVMYEINYTIHFPDDGYDNADFFCTSVLGAKCPFTIEEFNYNISFDKPLPASLADSIKVRSGALGSRSNALKATCEVIGNNIISGTASNINHHNAITIYANLPQGYWEDPASPAGIRMAWVAEWFANTFPSFTTILFSLLCILFVVVLVRLLRGRKAQRPIPVIEYTAPEGISSAEVGYIIDMIVDVKDLTSLIIWWASKGYLKIEEVAPEEGGKGKSKGKDEPEIFLHKLKDLPADAPSYQHKFWKVFFNKKDSVAISKIGKKYKQIESAQNALAEKYKDEHALQNFDSGMFITLLGFFLLAAFTILVCCWSTGTYHLLFCWVAALGYGLFYALGASDAKYVDSWKEKLLNYGVLSGLLCVSLVVAYFVIDKGAARCPSTVIYGITALSWILIFFSPNLQHDTPYRIELISRLLGFREFIRTAELPMLKAMVDENPDYFYEVLPYAIVFGLSDKWRDLFKEIDFKPPTWYNAGAELAAAGTIVAGAVAVHMLTDRFDSVISRQVESSSINPSSGSSGGGHSGGGGGYAGGGGGGGGFGRW